MKLIRLLSLLILSLSQPIWVTAQDMSLHEILAEEKGWVVVAQGYQFTDALCADSEGNLYFTDVAKGGAIYKVDLEGKLSSLLADAPKISGLKFGTDGKFYAATQVPEKQIVTISLDG